MRIGWALLAAVAFASLAHAQTPAFDPRSWKGAQAGPPTQVLTLGSPHLAQLGVPIAPEALTPLIDRLAAFKPTIITHEGISGEQCDTLKRYVAKYPDMYETYCWPTDDAEKATGLTIPAALAEIDTTLAAWPVAPTPAQRRHLAAVFLAAGDRPSAQVQWLRQAPGERIAADGIDEALLKVLNRAGGKANETMDVAVRLAARLGLERVYAVDDHTADSIQALAGPDFEASIQAVWSAPHGPAMDAILKRMEALSDGTHFLELYRLMNQPETQLAFVSADFGAALRTQTPALDGRQYVAWYETRNLRMVANIRAAFGNRPGARVLNIVGASHKAYYDAYLDMMSDVTVVDAEAVLLTPPP